MPKPKMTLAQLSTMVKSEPVEDDFGGASIVTNDGQDDPMPSETSESKSPVKQSLPPRTPGKKVATKIRGMTVPSTPPKIDPSTYGSISTPIGRRSARVAKMSAKKQ